MLKKSDTVDVIWLCQQIGRPSIYNIVHKIMALVLKGELRDGMLLPSIRAIAAELKLAPTTVATAINELKARNIIRSRPGYGTVIIDNPVTAFPLCFTKFSAVHNPTALINLTDTSPDDVLLPKLAPALSYALKVSKSNNAKYSPIAPQLKEAVLLNWPYPADSLIVLDTTFEAISHLLRFLVPVGGYVAVENPTAANKLDNLKRANINIIAVERDNEGPVLSSLNKALAKKPILFIYQPREHIATSRRISPQRLLEIAKRLESTNTIAVENDIIGDLSAFSAQSTGQFLPQQTVHIRCYAKAYGTELPLTVVSGPDKLMQALYNYRAYSLGWSNPLLQLTLAYLLKDEKSQLKISQARTKYIQRYSTLIAALKKRHIHLPCEEGVHFSLWLPVQSQQNALTLMQSKGILALGGTHFMVTPVKQQQEYIRIVTSCLVTNSMINQTADAIAHVLSAVKVTPQRRNNQNSVPTLNFASQLLSGQLR